jgi:Filamin/ABP280 repeat
VLYRNSAEAQFFMRFIRFLIGGVSIAVEGPSKAEVQCTDNGDETCSVSYFPKVAGEYTISVKVAHHHIPGSPFTAKIVPSGVIILCVSLKIPRLCNAALNDVHMSIDAAAGIVELASSRGSGGRRVHQRSSGVEPLVGVEEGNRRS